MNNKEIIKEFRKKQKDFKCSEEVEIFWLSKLDQQKQEFKRVVEERRDEAKRLTLNNNPARTTIKALTDILKALETYKLTK